MHADQPARRPADPGAVDAPILDDDAREWENQGDLGRGLGFALTISFGFWTAVAVVVTLVFA